MDTTANTTSVRSTVISRSKLDFSYRKTRNSDRVAFKSSSHRPIRGYTSQEQLELRPHHELVVAGGENAGLRLVGGRAVGQVGGVERELGAVDVRPAGPEVEVEAGHQLVKR